MRSFLLRQVDGATPSAPVSLANYPGQDASLALDVAGVALVHEVGHRLRWYDCHATQIWCGPGRATWQMAHLLAEALNATSPDEAARPLPQIRWEPRLGTVAHGSALVAEAQATGAELVFLAANPGLEAVAAALGVAAGAWGPALEPGESMRIDNGRLRWRFRALDEAPRGWARDGRP